MTISRQMRKRLFTGYLARQPAVMNAVGLATSLAMRAWLGTLRVQVDVADPRVDPRNQPRRVIYSLWHEDLLSLTHFFRHNGVHTLISDSADGEWIARSVCWLGFTPIRGSSGPSGGRAALRILREQQSIDLAVTTDGPRGPRRKFQMGAVYLASRLGMPIVPLSCGYERPRRAPSWDKLAFPRAFTRQVITVGQELMVPPDADARTLEEFRQRAEADLEAGSQRAQRLLDQWVASDCRPGEVRVGKRAVHGQCLKSA
jgi:lysophospholipid acyltransferase (LPLAT)-like uncharacterized protein